MYINWSQSDYVVVTSLKAVCVAYSSIDPSISSPPSPPTSADRSNWFIQKCRFHRMRSLFAYSHGSHLDLRSSCLIYLKYFYWQVACSHSCSVSFSFYLSLSRFFLLWHIFLTALHTDYVMKCTMCHRIPKNFNSIFSFLQSILLVL